MGAFKIAKTVLQSVFKKPATLMYPVVEREWQERTRGSIDIEDEKCILCGICSKRCPADAINVDRKGGTWEIHRMQCIQCGECVEACPKDCLSMNQKYTEPQTEKVVDVHNIEVSKPAGNDGGNTGGDGDLSCNKDECVFFGLCAKACPADALKVDRKEKIWEVDKEACVKCGACVDKCPKKCLGFGDADADTAAGDDDEKLVCNLEQCVYCGLCAKNCPCDALEVDRKEKVWKVDEEACVKCGACVDKCPKKCLTIGAAPEEAAAPSEKSIPVVDADTCIYCNACANECPNEAISAEMDNWTLDEEKCIGCSACLDVCPAEALEMKTVEA